MNKFLPICLIPIFFGKAAFTGGVICYGAQQQDTPHCVKVTDDCGYILSGGVPSLSGGNWDLLVAKLDSLGEIEWYKAYGDTTDNPGGFIKQISDGGYIGFSYNLVIKIDSLGNIDWAINSSGYSIVTLCLIQETCDDRYIGVGGDVFGIEDFLLLKLEKDGSIDTTCPFEYVSPIMPLPPIFISSINLISHSLVIACSTVVPIVTSPVVNVRHFCGSFGIESSERKHKELEFYCKPNPLINYTIIHYSLGGAGYGEIKIYDLCGRLVDLIEINKPQGSIVWRPKKELAQGVYHCILYANNKRSRHKMILLNR